jgi:hypothetical protein
LASAIPLAKLIFTKCYFFLDTIFLGFYTFVNCKVSLAGSMSTRQRENRKNGNQESSSKEASEEGSQENSKEEVSSQRNRQHIRGTPKASPDVFLGNARSLVFMRLRHASTAGFPDPRCELFPDRQALLSSQPRVTAGWRERTFGSLALPLAEARKWSATDLEAHMLTKVVPGHPTF